MMTLGPNQIEDLSHVQRLCVERGTDCVIIGATAYRIFIDDPHRETVDIDLALALDLAGMAVFEQALLAEGWNRSDRLEHRWVARRGTLMDLVPAGEQLRTQGKIEWAESGLTMSLAAFDHVFSDAMGVDLGGGLRFRVVPPLVQGLLKMASYLDNPYGRRKDLIDFRRLLQLYEANSERIFSEPVFEAGLPDIEFAGAFLLGDDMRAILTPKDHEIIKAFVAKVNGEIEHAPATDFEGRDTGTFRRQLSAFVKGLHRS
jgi:predicted nucleotidyltransferase